LSWFQQRSAFGRLPLKEKNGRSHIEIEMLCSSTPSHYTPFQEYPFTTNLLQLHSGQTFPAPGRWGKSNPVQSVQQLQTEKEKEKRFGRRAGEVPGG